MLSNEKSLKMNRLREAGRYNEAIEIIYDDYSRDGNWWSLYETFSSWRRDYYPSLNLPQAKQREMYRNVCKGASCESTSCPLNSIDKEWRVRFADELEREGLIDEAIVGLKKHCDKFRADKSHLKLGELYEKKGDFQAALRLYMNFNLVDRAAKCFEHTGDIDKVALYRLGEGKASDGIRLYEKAGPQDRVEWFRALTKFDLARFNHPLHSLSGLTSEKRVDIFERVGDKFSARLEELRSKDAGHPKQETEAIVKVRQDIAEEEGHLSWLDYKPFLLLNTEAAVLHRLAGNSTLEREACQRIDEAKEGAASQEGKEYISTSLHLYVASGQFAKAIIVGEDWVENRAERKKERGEDFTFEIGAIAHSYEMIGAFSETATWISRLISEWEKDSDWLAKGPALAQGYRWMSRVHLKMGQLSKAAESFLQYSIQQDTQHSSSTRYILPDRFGNYALAGELYLWGGDLDGWRRVVKHVLEWSPSYYGEQLPIFAKAAEDNGFYDEAAKIWDQIGGKSDVKKVTLAAKAQESGQEAAERNVDETPMLICSCGETLQPHWKLCPSCGKKAEMVCSCGELLKAGWKLCPACGKKVSE